MYWLIVPFVSAALSISHFVFATSMQGTINLAIVREMKPTCKLFEARKNAKSFMKSKVAKSGEGAHHAQVRAAKKRNRTESRVEVKKDSIEERRYKMKDAGLILCDEKCPETGRYCRGIFFHQKFFDRHTAARKHNFPTGLRARDRLMLAASKPGGLVYIGSRPDRASKNVTFGTVHEAVEGSPGEKDARCFGRFNRKEGVIPYRKPAKLLEVLEMLYNFEPKLRANEMRERMRAMRDTDGGLLFCFSKRNITGGLLTDDQIQSWINSRTQKKKKKGKGTPTEKDLEQERLINKEKSG
jgi:hypothetical protein